MEFFFFLDVYADRQLIDYYVLSFKLKDTSMIKTKNLEGREYITEIEDLETFKKSAYNIVLYEFGDEIDRFDDIEVALKSAYSMAYAEALRLNPKSIQPAMGYGNPPLPLIWKTFPAHIELDPFPENLDLYLENLVREMEEEMLWGDAEDDDEGSI